MCGGPDRGGVREILWPQLAERRKEREAASETAKQEEARKKRASESVLSSGESTASTKKSYLGTGQ